jgi:hypothetical protein
MAAAMISGRAQLLEEMRNVQERLEKLQIPICEGVSIDPSRQKARDHFLQGFGILYGYVMSVPNEFFED